MRDPQLLASVQATTLASEPLAVEEVRTGQIDRDARAAQSLDRLGVEVIGAPVIDQQRVRASGDPQRPIRSARPAPIGQTPIGLRGELWRPARTAASISSGIVQPTGTSSV